MHVARAPQCEVDHTGRDGRIGHLVNENEATEVAILGVSRSSMQPVYRDGGFVPRLMLPLSLSYDHRVIDGAMAARFTTWLAHTLADPRALLEAVL